MEKKLHSIGLKKKIKWVTVAYLCEMHFKGVQGEKHASLLDIVITDGENALKHRPQEQEEEEASNCSLPVWNGLRKGYQVKKTL